MAAGQLNGQAKGITERMKDVLAKQKRLAKKQADDEAAITSDAATAGVTGIGSDSSRGLSGNQSTPGASDSAVRFFVCVHSLSKL